MRPHPFLWLKNWLATHRRIRIGIWIALLVIAGLVPSLIVYSNSGDIGKAWIALKELHLGEFLAFLMPMLVLLGILLFGSYRLSSSEDIPRETIELLILGITIASYYAFGWPKYFTPEELKHKFSELCVILTLFLLAELAAALTFQAGKIKGSLEETERAVIGALNSHTETSIQTLKEQTNRSIGHLDAVLLELLTTKRDVNLVLEAVSEIRDLNTRSHLLGQLILYSRAWAQFFETVRQESPLCSSCCQSLLEIYMEKEIQGISPSAGAKHSLAIVTGDDLYLITLRKLLDQISSVEGQDSFAWAITNVLPEYWYHWGQQYGHYGRNELMDEYRNDVAKQVSQDREYRRMFLVKWRDIENTSTEYSERLNRLSTAEDLYEMSKRVILLVSDKPSETATDNDFLDIPLDASTWRSLLNEDVLREENMEKGVSYGILSKDLLTQLGDEWDVGSTVMRETGFGHKIWIKPRYLLEYWEEKYQSRKSTKDMSILVIGSELDLELLPEYTDLLLLGTKEGNKYQPIIAMSADISQSSKTMLMRIFTSPAVLGQLMKLWENAEGRTFTRQEFLDKYEETLVTANQVEEGTKTT